MRRWVMRGDGGTVPRPVLEAVGDLGISHAGLVARLLCNRDVRDGGAALGHLPVTAGQRLDVVFTPRLSQWQGEERLELEVVDLHGSSAPGAIQPTENTEDSNVP